MGELLKKLREGYGKSWYRLCLERLDCSVSRNFGTGIVGRFMARDSSWREQSVVLGSHIYIGVVSLLPVLYYPLCWRVNTGSVLRRSLGRNSMC